jgi:molybdopterin-containing oxidoreductase family membrane subunit
MTERSTEAVLDPLRHASWRFGVLVAVLVVYTFLFLFAWSLQLQHGLVVTGLGDWGPGGGIPWGFYIGTFIWWIGIAHGGIAVSAAVRVFKVDDFEPIARIAEVLTIIALSMAAANIIFDLGRPDRLFNTIEMLPSTIYHSPLAWDITVIALYFVLSITYLILTLRSELHAIRDRLPTYLQPLYSLFLLGYRPEEDEKMERMAWWLAIAILGLVPLLSGGVVPWLFGLIGSQPGWFGAAAGPSMLIESLASALAMVTIVAATFRYVYDWEFIDRDVFRGLAKVLGFLALAVLWFFLQEVLPGAYAPPTESATMTQALLKMPMFWLSVIGINIGMLYLFLGLIRPRLFKLPLVVLAAASITLSIWMKKVSFVVEGLLHPSYPPLTNLYPEGVYAPSPIELTITLGSIILAILLFAVATKVIPMVEIDTEEVES